MLLAREARVVDNPRAPRDVPARPANRPRHASLLSVVLLLASCPLGDCWPEVVATVRVGHGVDVPEDVSIFVVEVPRIYESDVVGTNDQGIPIGNQYGSARPIPRATHGDRVFEATFRGVGTVTWYYAFADLNSNGKLDPGEPFGVDPVNPRGAGCAALHTSISVDRVYACSRYGYWECWPSMEPR